MDERKPSPPPSRRRPDETLAVDPSDVRRHARRLRERDRPDPLRKVARYGALGLVVVALVAAYWNRETLLGIAKRSAPGDPAAPEAGGGAGVSNVEAPAVVGTRVPTSLDAEPAEDAAAVEPSAAPARSDPPAAGPSLAANEPRPEPAAAAPAPVAAPEPPPPPPEPETFEFGLDRVEVAESAASAAVLILRYGDRSRASSVSWWTEEGTAKAGVDYVNLGVLAEKFARGEQNRTIHIPIVGDHNAEGAETFFVVVRTRAGEGAEIPVKRLEVVINDDD